MKSTALIRLAQRAEEDNSLFASLIRQFRDAEEQTQLQIAANLGIGELALARLALCERPRKSSILADLSEIARYVGVDSRKLVEFFRYAEAVEALRASSSSDAQSLQAARDKDADIPE